MWDKRQVKLPHLGLKSAGRMIVRGKTVDEDGLRRFYPAPQPLAAAVAEELAINILS